jgi:hypothetical protein
MSGAEIAILAVQAAGTVAVASTLLVYLRIHSAMRDQNATMQRQLEVAREGSTAQNILSIVHYIQSNDVRDARRTVLARLREKPLPWSDDEERAASLVCSSYDLVGILVDMGLVPMAPIRHWRTSIERCQEALRSFLAEMRRRAGADVWMHFEWLAEQVASESDEGLSPSLKQWKDKRNSVGTPEEAMHGPV